MERIETTLNDARVVSNELLEKLSKIKIKLDRNLQSDVIQAIRTIYGSEFVSDNGNVYITYQMYCECINLIRDLGKQIGATQIG